MADDGFSRHPDFAGNPIDDDAIVVNSVLMAPTHSGKVIPHVVSNSTFVGVMEHKPGKHCVSLCLAHHEQAHGYIAVMQPFEVDNMVQLLLDAKDNAARLNAGGKFVPSAPLGGRQ